MGFTGTQPAWTSSKKLTDAVMLTILEWHRELPKQG